MHLSTWMHIEISVRNTERIVVGLRTGRSQNFINETCNENEDPFIARLLHSKYPCIYVNLENLDISKPHASSKLQCIFSDLIKTRNITLAVCVALAKAQSNNLFLRKKKRKVRTSQRETSKRKGSSTITFLSRVHSTNLQLPSRCIYILNSRESN